MIRTAFAIGILSFVWGCGGPTTPSEPDFKEKSANLTSYVSDLRSDFEALKSHIEQFDDGSTDWKDIVAELDSKISDVELALDMVESQSEKVNAEIEYMFEPGPPEDPRY